MPFFVLSYGDPMVILWLSYGEPCCFIAEREYPTNKRALGRRSFVL